MSWRSIVEFSILAFITCTFGCKILFCEWEIHKTLGNFLCIQLSIRLYVNDYEQIILK